MSELIIKLKGEVTDTNFDEWKNDLLKQLKQVNTELSTDDDFANAESDVKAIKAGEKALKNAKASALEQADEIQKLFAAIDEVSDEARDARLALERQIKKRKAEIKEEVVDEGIEAVRNYFNDQSDALQSVRHSWFDRQAFEEEIKGKRTTASMQKAVTALVVKIKGEIADREALIDDNNKVLDNIDDEYSTVFQDKQSLLLMDADTLQATIDQRIEYHNAEIEKQQADKDAQKTSAPAEEAELEQEPQTPEEPGEPEAPEEQAIHPADQSHIISIEVFAEIDAAQELFDEIDDRYSNREIIGEIKLI